MAKVYMAALFQRREELEKLAPLLELAGHQNNARWVAGMEDGLEREEISDLDLQDVKECDILMSFTHPRGTPTPGGGRHVEFGYALALEKRMVLIGPRENVFHHDHRVEQYDHIMAFINIEIGRAKYV